MRKKQKQQILEIIQNLHILHEQIRARLSCNDYQAAQSALNDCQEAAIHVGEAIEEIEGVETPAVFYLERYCEKVYQVSVMLQNLSGKKAYKSLKSSLAEAEKAIKQMPVKLEAVFLPYKASMWDSLESVWMAADKDPNCDAYVIPIPYYHKNNDGSFGEMQYEGADFPSYVPIVDWQQYSLEKEHPDIIFIHNPYDKYNFITSVHPYFYASRIRNYTDKLVYIPYFVHQNDRVKDSYCVLPGTIYANTVILQSEKVREQYIKYFEDTFPELLKKQGRQAIENKFQALGSPKFDIGTEKETVIPDEWRPFLEQGKKVIFFNTHLSGLMKDRSEIFLKKLNWVFEFYKKREDVVLLWRPHPLMIETARSMNPEAVEPYLQLVDKFRQQKIGIYDDSTDLHRAVNLADAYYGDTSSVVELFKNQGKPVMIMAQEIAGD